MKIALALTLLTAFGAGAAEARRPPAFQASGASPGWQLMVRDDSMILTFGPDGMPPGVAGQSYLTGGVRRQPPAQDGALGWQAGKDAILIVVEARPANCTDAAGKVGAYRVTVRFQDRTLEGCGAVPAARKRR
jgi:uncharacterized membrane protein